MVTSEPGEGGMVREDLDRRLRIIESSYGRDHGWDLEHHGVCIAVLSEPRWVEMFWVAYRIEPTTDDPKALEMLRSDEFWNSCDFVFRNRGFREEVVEAIGNRDPREDEVTVRSLYLTIKEPRLWEAMGCFRRLQRARRRMRTFEGWRRASEN
jgi:hypothetical protein